jgi:DNA/RNA endonuclease YhcR with UshA esterase domain
MKRKTFCLVLCFSICAGSVGSITFAQKTSTPAYDLTAEITLHGTVQEVKEVPKSCQKDDCTHIMLKTTGGVIEVQVAPAAFLKDMDFAISPGDQVNITGCKVVFNDSPLVLARIIAREKNELVLRDDKGAPVWTWMKK